MNPLLMPLTPILQGTQAKWLMLPQALLYRKDEKRDWKKKTLTLIEHRSLCLYRQIDNRRHKIAVETLPHWELLQNTWPAKFLSG